MRIHLINVRTGHYFQSPGRWTGNAAQAFCFGSGSQAISLTYELGIEDAELLLVFDLPYYREVRLRLGKAGEPITSEDILLSFRSSSLNSPMSCQPGMPPSSRPRVWS